MKAKTSHRKCFSSETLTVVAYFEQSHSVDSTVPIDQQVRVAKKTNQNQLAEDEAMLGVFLMMLRNR